MLGYTKRYVETISWMWIPFSAIQVEGFILLY